MRRTLTSATTTPTSRRKYNELVASWLPELRAALAAADDPFRLAVWMAMAGNYIDFGILKEIDDARLKRMLSTPDERAVDVPALEELRAEASAAKRLVYACDNCGEVVLDMLLMEELKKMNPALAITALVRGENVLNDVTAEDARAVGLDRVAEIVGNGSNIGGTQMNTSARSAAGHPRRRRGRRQGTGQLETLTGAGPERLLSAPGQVPELHQMVRHGTHVRPAAAPPLSPDRAPKSRQARGSCA